MSEDVVFLCDNCGAENLLAIRQSGDSIVEFWEDCPFCSATNLVHVERDEDDNSEVWCESSFRDGLHPLATVRNPTGN